jgi:hypothetical protein
MGCNGNLSSWEHRTGADIRADRAIQHHAGARGRPDAAFVWDFTAALTRASSRGSGFTDDAGLHRQIDMTLHLEVRQTGLVAKVRAAPTLLFSARSSEHA